MAPEPAQFINAWTAGLGRSRGARQPYQYRTRQNGEERSKTEKERLKKLQIFIVKQVAGRKRLRGFTSRVEGLVAGLTTVRAIDRLKWLVENEAADPAHVKAWQKLRNRSVHPATQGDVDVASLDFQKTVDQLNQVTVLLYHIVFHLRLPRSVYRLCDTRFSGEELSARVNFTIRATDHLYLCQLRERLERPNDPKIRSSRLCLIEKLSKEAHESYEFKGALRIIFEKPMRPWVPQAGHSSRKQLHEPFLLILSDRLARALN